MNIKQKSKYWIDIADYDLETARSMQKSRRYLYTIFMCQQAIEKILKALYIQKYRKEAPFTHNLIYLQS
jgi:HEPN domain-containing protein